MINIFANEYYFLSNFYPCKVTFDGLTYQSSEAAYQAQKTNSLEKRGEFVFYSPEQAKKAGRFVHLRTDWEDVKIDIMYKILRAKFTQNIELKEKLLATGNHTLEESNWWHDTFWGVCNGKGENHLGKLLMKLREELSEQSK